MLQAACGQPATAQRRAWHAAGMSTAADSAESSHVWWQPQVRALRRSADQVQFGLSPGCGVVLGGLNDAEASWLLSLGSTLPATSPRHRTRAVAIDTAQRWGLDSDRAAQLLQALRAHRVILASPPSDLINPPSSDGCVRVLGRGVVPAALREHFGDSCGHTQGPPGRMDGGTCAQPSLTVLVVNDAIGPKEGAQWAHSGQAHLPVVVQAHRVVLGPLVSEPQGPCLMCLDLIRRDIDGAWPRIAAQMQTSPVEWGSEVDADAALGAAIVGLCSMVARCHLDGVWVPSGLTWEINGPLPQVLTRHWHPHPSCPAHDGSIHNSGIHDSGIHDSGIHAAC